MTHLHYRVWDGEQMHYWDDEGISLTIKNDGSWFLWHYADGCVVSSDDKDAVLMWGTGVKDKNSRLIYDRDVYHQGDLNILHVVEFKGGSFAGKQISSSSYTGLEYWKDRIEVIGDVYRNPELLKEAE
ncbi:YopX family protein [Bacillus sonorensis]|uniref:YopX family protein n=1 Tax=Bacillus sonorensis TaxID=119858 RepID=UPI0022822376|nr:YopX family protein [Bacillus sonorensis]MCY8025688.1 YopX family protein [Bacillus sonorensis]MCY8087628.1 YopX family protein [Bacillus sonorensis]MCY8271422.1 YopX family protein [Bacillus sonorensis]MCY8603958.1 YopX family protein [Bacillus sonorensis]